MTADVVVRKLAYLRQVLTDLAPYAGASLTAVQSEHYKIERLFELLVMCASDILFHELAELGKTPNSYREAFDLAAQQGWLPDDLAHRLREAAGMRNVLVHLYADIDYTILHDSIKPALKDFGRFLAIFESRI